MSGRFQGGEEGDRGLGEGAPPGSQRGARPALLAQYYQALFHPLYSSAYKYTANVKVVKLVTYPERVIGCTAMCILWLF